MAEKNSLWKNIRNKAAKNRRTGATPKKPTAEMLRQEAKIKAKKYAEGGETDPPYRPLSIPMEGYEPDSVFYETPTRYSKPEPKLEVKPKPTSKRSEVQNYYLNQTLNQNSSTPKPDRYVTERESTSSPNIISLEDKIKSSNNNLEIQKEKQNQLEKLNQERISLRKKLDSGTGSWIERSDAMKRLSQIDNELGTKSLDKEYDILNKAGQIGIKAGKYILPGAAPVLNAIDTGLDVYQYSTNPNIQNATSLQFDMMSPYKITSRSGRSIKPFGVIGDIYDTYNILNEKAKGGYMYKKGGPFGVDNDENKLLLVGDNVLIAPPLPEFEVFENYDYSNKPKPNYLTPKELGTRQIMEPDALRVMNIDNTKADSIFEKPIKKNPKNRYKEINSTKADFIRSALPVPMNVGQMISKEVFKDARMSNSSLSDAEKIVLWNTIQNAKKRTGKDNGGTEYSDYASDWGSKENFNDWFNRGKLGASDLIYNSISNPGFRVASTVGRGRYWTDPNNPDNIQYTDVYDWNSSEKNYKGNNLYQKLRNEVRNNEQKNLDTLKNEPYRMNFSFNREEMEELIKNNNRKKEIDNAISDVGFPFANGGATMDPPNGIRYITPTRQDSLMLYNNALDKIRFYSGNPDYTKISSNTNFKDPKVRKNLIWDAFAVDPIVRSSLVDQIAFNAASKKNAVTSGPKPSKPMSADEKRKMQKQVGLKKFGKVAGTNLTSLGDVAYEQPDVYYNPLAPPIYLHPNISPQGSEAYYSQRLNDFSDIPNYDPLAVAPWDTLNESQKKERLQKYGTSGTPLASTSTRVTKPNIDRLQSKQYSNSNSNEQPNIIGNVENIQPLEINMDNFYEGQYEKYRRSPYEDPMYRVQIPGQQMQIVPKSEFKTLNDNYALKNLEEKSQGGYTNPYMYYSGGPMYYGNGGKVWKHIGAGAYALGEGILDTVTGGATDQITDKGFEWLTKVGNKNLDLNDPKTAKFYKTQQQIKGYGNVGGSIGAAIFTGQWGPAIGQSAKGLNTAFQASDWASDDFKKWSKIGSTAIGIGAGFAGGLNTEGASKGASEAAAKFSAQASKVAPYANQAVGMFGKNEQPLWQQAEARQEYLNSPEYLAMKEQQNQAYVNQGLSFASHGGNINNNSLNLQNSMRNRYNDYRKKYNQGGSMNKSKVDFISDESGLHRENANGGVILTKGTGTYSQGGPSLVEKGEGVIRDEQGNPTFILPHLGDGDPVPMLKLNANNTDFELDKDGNYILLNETIAGWNKRERHRGSPLRNPENNFYAQERFKRNDELSMIATEENKKLNAQKDMMVQGALQYAANGGKINKDIEKILNDDIQSYIKADNYYAYGGYLPKNKKFNMPYSNGGKLPKEVLRARVKAHMSLKEANSYVDQYDKGGYVYKPMVQPMLANGGPMVSNVSQPFNGPSAQNRGGMMVEYGRGGMMYDGGPPYDLPGMADMSASEYNNVNTYLNNLNTLNFVDNQGNTSSILSRIEGPSKKKLINPLDYPNLFTPYENPVIIPEDKKEEDMNMINLFDDLHYPTSAPYVEGWRRPLTERRAKLLQDNELETQTPVTNNTVNNIQSKPYTFPTDNTMPGITGNEQEMPTFSNQPSNFNAEDIEIPFINPIDFGSDLDYKDGKYSIKAKGIPSTIAGDIQPIPPVSQMPNALQKYDPKEPWYNVAAGAAQVLPSIFATKKFLDLSKRKLTPEKISPEQVNLERSRITAKEEGRRALDSTLRFLNTKGSNIAQVAGNARETLLNYIKNMGANIAKSYETEENTNAQLRQQNAFANQQYANAFKQLNEEIYQSGIENAIAATQEAGKMTGENIKSANRLRNQRYQFRNMDTDDYIVVTDPETGDPVKAFKSSDGTYKIMS